MALASNTPAAAAGLLLAILATALPLGCMAAALIAPLIPAAAAIAIGPAMMGMLWTVHGCGHIERRLGLGGGIGGRRFRKCRRSGSIGDGRSERARRPESATASRAKLMACFARGKAHTAGRGADNSGAHANARGAGRETWRGGNIRFNGGREGGGGEFAGWRGRFDCRDGNGGLGLWFRRDPLGGAFVIDGNNGQGGGFGRD